MLDFHKLLLEAVDEILVSSGDSAKQISYFHLKKSFGLRKEDVPKRIGTFARFIEGIFGPGDYYPSLQKVVEGLNEGADVYVVKPLDMTKVLETINEQLRKQQEEKRYSQQKIAEFIETLVKELIEEEPNFHCVNNSIHGMYYD